MGWLSRWRERRSQENVLTGDAVLDAILRRTSTITPEEALNIPTVAGCIEFIGNVVASLPVKLYREVDGKVEEMKTDPRVALLNDDTGDLLSGTQMKKAIVRDYFLRGAAYMYKRMRGNQCEGLHYVKGTSVSVNVGADPIYKTAQIFVNGNPYRDFEFVKLTRNTVDGVTGAGIIAENPKILSLAYAALIYENTLLKTGGNKRGFLSSENRLDKPAMDALKEGFESLYSNSASGVIVLNKGLKFEQASNTSVELQLSENKTLNSIEIAKLFNMTPDVARGKAEHDAVVNAIRTGVLPVLKAFEGALNKDLLLETEKKAFYFAFDTKELLKGDILRRYQAYKMGVDANFLGIDEVRYEEDLPPLGISFVKLGLQDVLYDPQTKTVYTPNTGRAQTMTGIPMPIDDMERGEKLDESGT